MFLISIKYLSEILVLIIITIIFGVLFLVFNLNIKKKHQPIFSSIIYNKLSLGELINVILAIIMIILMAVQTKIMIPDHIKITNGEGSTNREQKENSNGVKDDHDSLVNNQQTTVPLKSNNNNEPQTNKKKRIVEKPEETSDTISVTPVFSKPKESNINTKKFPVTIHFPKGMGNFKVFINDTSFENIKSFNLSEGKYKITIPGKFGNKCFEFIKTIDVVDSSNIIILTKAKIDSISEDCN